MTDDRSDEPDFDDPTYAAVSELLASAKVEGSIPADVAARLDATLASLSGAAPASPPVPEEDGDVVVPLRRRSRWAPRLLAAAAVVVVAGAGAVGLNGVLKGSDVSSDKSSSSVPGAVADADAGGDVSPLIPTASTPESIHSDSLDSGFSTTARGASVLVFSKAQFADQASGLAFTTTGRLLSRSTAQLGGATTGSAAAPQRSTASSAASPAPSDAVSQQTTKNAAGKSVLAALSSCAGPRIPGTTTYPVVLDTQPAALVVHPENAGTRLVEAWSCDGSRVLVFTTVPA